MRLGLWLRLSRVPAERGGVWGMACSAQHASHGSHVKLALLPEAAGPEHTLCAKLECTTADYSLPRALISSPPPSSLSCR